MHFPEQQLMAYLRVFLTQERADDILNDVATTALAADVQSQIEFFCLAHWLMDDDDHRSVIAEVVALTEEAGLSVKEAAIVLDVPVGEVEAARRRAWADSGGDPSEPVGSALDIVPDRVTGPAPVSRTELISGPAEELEGVRRTWRPGVVAAATAAVVVAVGALAVLMLSSAGQTRLIAHGVNPVLAWVVMVVLIIGGVALIGVMATAEDPAHSGAEGAPGRPKP